MSGPVAYLQLMNFNVLAMIIDFAGNDIVLLEIYNFEFTVRMFL